MFDYIYCIQAIVFFEAYPDDGQRNTKIAEPFSRRRKYVSTDIILDDLPYPKKTFPVSFGSINI